MISKISNQGNILYLEDSLTVVLSGSVTASTIVSVDSRFTVTLHGITPGSASAYVLQVSNINPFIKQVGLSTTGTGTFTSGANGNMYPLQDDIHYSLNPELESSWVSLNSASYGIVPFGNVGNFALVNGVFRIARIINAGGFSPGAKAHFFLEKQMPVIQ